jgi:hypothetical protein
VALLKPRRDAEARLNRLDEVEMNLVHDRVAGADA